MRGKKNLKNPIWCRKSFTAACDRQKAKATNRDKTIKTQKEKTKALNTTDINALLKKSDNFVGTFSSDQLSNLVIRSFPCFIVVNTAPNLVDFGHWLAIRIDKFNIEIFDSFGGDPNKWGKNSTNLVKFLKYSSRGKNILVSPVLQTSTSQMCGYFSIYFILARKYLNFKQIISPFSLDLKLNDTIVLELLDAVL